jgi:hypothetical protein
MVPFDVNMSGKRVGISFESLIWFFVVTAAATVVGELVYEKWIQPYLANLPSLPGSTPTAQLTQNPAPGGNNILQFPLVSSAGMMNPTNNPNLPQ